MFCYFVCVMPYMTILARRVGTSDMLLKNLDWKSYAKLNAQRGTPEVGVSVT